MPDIDILEPTTVAEAAASLREHGDEAKVIAGGTALVLMLKNRLISPRYLITLSRIAGLDGIRYDPNVGLRLGALTTIRQAETSPVVREHFPVLAQTFGQVANVRVRNAATVGGNLTEADYASDPPCVLLALRARVVVEGPSGRREIPLTEFFRDFYETALAPDEILTEVIVPSESEGALQSYLKYVTRSSEDRPCIGACAWVRTNAGICQELRVTLGAVTSTPQEFPEAETLAAGQQLTPDLIGRIAEHYAQAIDPLSDLRGSAWYRREMASV
ncbi:MAG TPA: xanthine dehydrogenase family protein subunit M, partial [Dehalococcoidia bacterium]|nr:xanthine dehydrogenase family protein subunit M [Dehalococcoidia bacterium]